ncbi:MAG: sodium/solute symporter [Phycisphaerales bacterium]|nr:sodium/solute symporter [Phycisphaerales bacterium]
MPWIFLAEAPFKMQTGRGEAIDYVIIVGYLALVLGFGSIFGRFTKSTRDFFFSGSKFSWWLIGMSMVATGVGSHSFIKYAQTGYEHGLSSTMSYTNDWFFIPFFMFGWLPIIYFSRVRSVAEYFERRFNTPCRIAAMLLMLNYMLMYIGYNLFTLGKAANQVLGIDVETGIIVISVVSAIYITAGGQTAVIFTDLMQGAMLLFAGLLLFAIGLNRIGMDGGIIDGLSVFWQHLSLTERLPFSGFNKPNNFSFVGVFWQDAIAGSIMFLFVNQGLMMRFMAARSVNEGRKCILFNTLLILPISAVVVGNAGWLCNVCVKMGLIEAPNPANEAFVTVAEFLCHPGVFGFVLAALAAALMSTLDTLTNASASLFVYDVYQPYLAKDRSDRHYMRVARIATVCTSMTGLGLALWFATRGEDLYKLHGFFQALVTPPIVAAVFMGAFWKRFTSEGALASMVGGIGALYLSIKYPILVEPFANWLHGVEPDKSGDYPFMRAMFGLVNAGVIGVVVSWFTTPKADDEIAGLWIGSMKLSKKLFKGGEPNPAVGKTVQVMPFQTIDGTCSTTTAISLDPAKNKPDAEIQRIRAAGGGPPPAEYPIVRLAKPQMERLKANEGDLVFIADARRWLGGLRSCHARLGLPHDEPGLVYIDPETFEESSLLPGKPMRVDLLF